MMNTSDDIDARKASAALAQAATAAGYAPSIHNTQPWKWRVEGNQLDLYIDPARQLPASDPGGRLLIVSAGAALHHARVAIAAEGWTSHVDRMPDPHRPDLLARVRMTGRIAVTTEAMRLMQAIRIRHTDRRPVQDAPVPAGALDAVRAAVEGQHAHLHLLADVDTLDLAVAANEAQALEELDPQWRQEIVYWAGAATPEGLGVPASAIPAEAARTTVPGRDFGHRGELPISAGNDRAARYAIIWGEGDTRRDWLIGGEALSAGWLAAVSAGVSLVPLSATVEVDRTRQTLRRLLSHLGDPYLVIRLGLPDPDHAGPPPTPRLPADQTVEVV